MASMKNAPMPKPIVAVQKPLSCQAWLTSSRNDNEIITPPVNPMRKPNIRLPGFRNTASNPPRPVPRLATRLTRKIFRITFMVGSVQETISKELP